MTEDGKTVKRGVLLRTAKLANATEADTERLLSVYHLAVDVDFRSDSEVEKAHDPELTGVEYLIENGVGEDGLEAFMKTLDQVSPEFMENAIQMDDRSPRFALGLYHPGVGRDGGGDSGASG